MQPTELDEMNGAGAPLGKMTVTYQGPVAPHWHIRTMFGEEDLMSAFYSRVHARLLLLPPHDPQFRRNQERVMRDAKRENIVVDWDLGYANLLEPQTPEPQVADQQTPEPQVAGQDLRDA